MDTNVITSTTKIFFIFLFAIIIAIKIMNIKGCNKIQIVSSVIINILISLIYEFVKIRMDTIAAILISYILISIWVKIIIKKQFTFAMLVTIISLSISFVLWGFSVILSSALLCIGSKTSRIDNIYANMILIILIEIILMYLLLRVKRFNKGLAFLKNKIDEDYINLIMFNISSIVIMSYCIVGNYYGNLTRHILICFIFLSILMFVIIQKILTLVYKQNLLKKTIEDYKNEIEEKDKKIKELSNEKFNISKLNHEFYNRQKSLELKIKEMNLETSEEIGILQRIQTVTEEYSTKLQQIKGKNKLPLTNVETIDDMLKYMQAECYNKNIDFKLQIEANINSLINNKISETKLETLIGDHIKDAIIAVNNSNNKYKSIMTIIGIKDNCYELCIYDSGIEFEIPTLLNLGLEAITTHKDTGGSGIGFITTFETLKYCKASLIIEERHKEIENDYTKAVIIRFDDKNEYKIRSYRAKEIIRQAKDNRIIIENI